MDTTVKICPHCGKETAADAKYCRNCGKYVGDVPAPAPTPAPQVTQEPYTAGQDMYNPDNSYNPGAGYNPQPYDNTQNQPVQQQPYNPYQPQSTGISNGVKAAIIAGAMILAVGVGFGVFELFLK